MKQKIDEFKKKWFRPFPNTEEGNRLREERESDLNALLRELMFKAYLQGACDEGNLKYDLVEPKKLFNKWFDQWLSEKEETNKQQP